jgi:hypothetical protein
MMVKEWTVDEKGHPLAVWVECDRVTSPQNVFRAEAATQPSGSNALASIVAPIDAPASGPALEPCAVPTAGAHATLRGASTGFNLKRVYTVLRGILP